MHVTDPQTINAARKERRCYWCGESIPVGAAYVRWECFDGGKVLSVTVHPECKQAWNEGMTGVYRWYYTDEVGYAAHSRGCLCENGACRCVLTVPVRTEPIGRKARR